MIFCDSCNHFIPPNKIYILTTREVVSSFRYWRIQLSKYNSVIIHLPSKEERRDFFIREVISLINFPISWTVCFQCSYMFKFNKPLALESAIKREERLDAGPSNLELLKSMIYPIIIEFVENMKI